MKRIYKEIKEKDIIGTWGENTDNYQITFLDDNIYHLTNNKSKEPSTHGKYSIEWIEKDNEKRIHLQDDDDIVVIILMLLNDEIILKIEDCVIYKI